MIRSSKFSNIELGIIETCVNENLTLEDTQKVLALQDYNRKLSSIRPKYEHAQAAVKRKRKYIEKANANIKQHRLKGMLYSARQRAKDKDMECNLEYDDLVKLYDSTNGKCKYTNRHFVFTKAGESSMKTNLNAPSLDRIDNNKGYTLDNVQIVSLAYNKMKCDSSNKMEPVIMVPAK